MLRTSAVAVALLAAAPIVAATGAATIQNGCSFPVYLWTVTDQPGEMKTIGAGESYSEGYLTNPNGGGVSMKIATEPDTAGSITQFEYTLDSTLWYDMSMINGNAFMQQGTTLVPSDSSCRTVDCPAGLDQCAEAYNTPDQNYATASCGPDVNTHLLLCSAGSHLKHGGTKAAANIVDTIAPHKKHHHHHHHKGPAPAPSAAPAPPAPSAPVAPAAPAPAVGDYTTFVTQIVTITAAKRDASPTAAPERRAVHRHHFHRHGHGLDS